MSDEIETPTEPPRIGYKAKPEGLRIPIFTLTGVDEETGREWEHEYTMPANPPATVILRYLRSVRLHGHDVASGELLEELIGEDAYLALMNHPGVGIDELGAVMNIVSEHSLGLITKARGNSQAGQHS
jgi:hypothetical protein